MLKRDILPCFMLYVVHIAFLGWFKAFKSEHTRQKIIMILIKLKKKILIKILKKFLIKIF